MKLYRAITFLFGLCLVLMSGGMTVKLVAGMVAYAEKEQWEWFYEWLMILPFFVLALALGLVALYTAFKGSTKKKEEPCS